MTTQPSKPKIKYPSKEAAQHAAFEMWRKGPDVDIDDLRPYYCIEHNCWHIGSKAKFLAKVGIKG